MFLAIYLLVQGGAFHNAADEWFPFAATESMVKHLDMDMDSAWWAATTNLPFQRFGRNGNLYPIYSPLQSAAGAPLYWLAIHDPAVGIARLTLATNAVVTALTDVALIAFLTRLDYRRSVALLTTVTYAVGTLSFVYAKSYFSEPLSTLALMIAVAGLHRAGTNGSRHGAAVAGLGLGLLVINRPTFFVALPICVIYGIVLARRHGRRVGDVALAAAIAAIPFALCIVAMAWTDWWRFGDPFDLGYANQATRFDAPFLVGFVGQLVSPGKGLLVYCPVLLISIAGARLSWKRDPTTTAMCGALVLLSTALYSAWHAWFGGSHAWGPRYLVPVLPLAMVPAAATFEYVLRVRTPLLMAACTVAVVGSAAIQIAGASFDYIPYVDRLFQENHVDTLTEDTQLVPVYFSIGNSQPIHQFEYSAPRFSDVGWRAADDRGGTIVLWQPLLALLLLLASSSGVAMWAATRTRGRAGPLALVALAILTLWVTSFAWSTYEQLANTHPDPYRAIYKQLARVARPGDALVTLSIEATSQSFLYDASPTRHVGLGREDALPIRPEIRRLLETIDARSGRVWIIGEGAPDRVENWVAAGSEARQVATSGTLRLTLFTHPLGAPTPREAQFGDELQLTGYRLDGPAPRAGGNLDVSLFWQAARPSQDLTAFVHVLDSHGKLVAQHDGPPRAGMAPTHTWLPAERVRDRHVVPLSSTLSPGTYTLAVGLYRATDGKRITASSSGREWQDDSVVLTQIAILPAGG